VRTARRAAAHGEIAGRDDHFAAVDAAQTVDLAFGTELLEAAAGVVRALAAQYAKLVKGFRIGE
jgi:hypothetical protein